MPRAKLRACGTSAPQTAKSWSGLLHLSPVYLRTQPPLLVPSHSVSLALGLGWNRSMVHPQWCAAASVTHHSGPSLGAVRGRKCYRSWPPGVQVLSEKPPSCLFPINSLPTLGMNVPQSVSVSCDSLRGRMSSLQELQFRDRKEGVTLPGKPHVHDLQVACGINMTPYNPCQKPAHHTFAGPSPWTAHVFVCKPPRYVGPHTV